MPKLEKRHPQADMTTGRPAKRIFFFALPMLLGNIFQQLYNMVDSIVVGNFVGPEALGAVGGTFPIAFVAIAVANGLGMGCSVVTSQYLGAGDRGAVRVSVTTALFFNLAVAVVLSAAGMLFARPVLQLMNTPAATIGMATDYLFIYFAGLAPMFLYNAVSGAFRALGDSKTPLYYLILASFLNVVLDLLLVIGSGMGVAGVAVATVLSQVVCALLALGHILRRLRQYSVPGQSRAPDMAMLKTIVRLAVPATAQELSVSISSILFQSVINKLGPMLVSGYTAANKIQSIAFVVNMNLGLAVSTFVAQNMGAGKVERVKKGFRCGCVMALAATLCTFALLQLLGPHLIGLFVDAGSAPQVIAGGTYHLTHVAFVLFIEAIMLVAEGLLKGAGDMRLLLVCTTAGMALQTAAVFVLVGRIGFAAVWVSMGIGCLVEMTISLWRYFQGGWKNKAITRAAAESRRETSPTK
ncbi:Multidrug export protein mepA [Anaerotruncus sp. 2789STDY5834896]|uniref:Probable multidrug resistance protein NorM n=1 Tax=uncultured Anaerotruncus sp. TaxID=905011 RepID=A0A1C6JAP2_9FIRM|nr:Multidrug export protein mepA [uncultured Anaerotruncus sp.]